MFPRPRRIETELSRDVLNPARVTLSWANSPTLGTYSSPRMRRADIEVPNLAVDVNSWARSACYPRGSFYPLSHTPSTRKCGITKPDFRPCSSCRGEPVSSRVLQFRRAPCRDSAQVVTPFVRVGTYPTRNFATLGPL